MAANRRWGWWTVHPSILFPPPSPLFLPVTKWRSMAGCVTALSRFRQTANGNSTISIIEIMDEKIDEPLPAPFYSKSTSRYWSSLNCNIPLTYRVIDLKIIGSSQSPGATLIDNHFRSTKSQSMRKMAQRENVLLLLERRRRWNYLVRMSLAENRTIECPDTRKYWMKALK